jgi:tetrahydromethanopterin S-methyltransferase subunit G
MKKIFSVFMVLLLFWVVVPNLDAGPSEHRISKRISELRQGIYDGVHAGAITPDESNKLQSRLDKIQENFDKVQGKRHGMSDGEVTSINSKLDALSKDIKREKRDLQTTRTDDNISRRINEMEKRIKSGHRNGSLTGSEARSLQARLDGIRDHLERAQKNGLGDQEIRAINHELDELSKKISKEKNDRQRAS